VWDDASWQRTVDAWGGHPSAAEIAQKTVWRNHRLAALAAHKKTQSSS